jgi:hypothetical protein
MLFGPMNLAQTFSELALTNGVGQRAAILAGARYLEPQRLTAHTK